MKTKNLLSELELFKDIIFEQESENPTEENPEAGYDFGKNLDTETLPSEIQDSSKRIGQIYELTKIYNKLKSLDGFLLKIPDKNTIKIRNIVKNSLDVFKILVDNIEAYRDKLDQIIVMYYHFIKRLLLVIESYYKKKANDNKRKNNAN